jgi:hypothetical protein
LTNAATTPAAPNPPDSLCAYELLFIVEHLLDARSR